VKIRINLNGKWREDDVESRLLLVHYLREAAGLTGTHIGCETSLCGACTVLLNGGLGTDGNLHPLQQGFWEEHGLHCGFCTPGMILAAHQLLSRNPHPTREQIRQALEGNLCRCTGYQHIVKAIEWAVAHGGE
jgi:aerobic carbon-monoxide dehydrogenase small subunit